MPTIDGGRVLSAALDMLQSRQCVANEAASPLHRQSLNDEL